MAMKTFAIILLSMLLVGNYQPAAAAELQQTSRSAGKLKMDQDIDLSNLLRQSEPVVKTLPTSPENFLASETGQNVAGIANRHDQLFEIFDADVQLIADLDGDGYHHAFNVFFDVDVSSDSATVYAKLYLSREGGPWSQYFTTDLFSIHINDFSDAYEVETELLSGYDPGYYAVLVEIYSLDHAFMVASEVLDYHYLGKDLLIEDRKWDEPFDEFHAGVHFSGHGGSMASLLLIFLIIQVVIAARGARASTPCKTSDNNNNRHL